MILIRTHGLLPSYTTRKVCFLITYCGHNKYAELQIGKFILYPPSDLRVIMATCRATWKICPRFVFLPQLMASCCRATKHFLLMMHPLVTCVSKATRSKNTCSFADIINPSNVYGKYITANKVDTP